MKIKKIIMGLFISLIVISVLFAITDRRIQAQAAVSDSEVSKKLDDILKNQKKMLEELASIKAE
ncbi:MAG: hypothetical protein HZC19_02495 [Candidatus Omnitrophica bacterium]|nr:hypothetical protein [Candidatus Omnitrophota bacterium]